MLSRNAILHFWYNIYMVGSIIGERMVELGKIKAMILRYGKLGELLEECRKDMMWYDVDYRKESPMWCNLNVKKASMEEEQSLLLNALLDHYDEQLRDERVQCVRIQDIKWDELDTCSLSVNEHLKIWGEYGFEKPIPPINPLDSIDALVGEHTGITKADVNWAEITLGIKKRYSKKLDYVNYTTGLNVKVQETESV